MSFLKKESTFCLYAFIWHRRNKLAELIIPVFQADAAQVAQVIVEILL